jgi:hypothetical protein
MARMDPLPAKHWPPEMRDELMLDGLIWKSPRKQRTAHLN